MSSAATATSAAAAAAAATTAGSGAGEGAEEAAKDSADIAAFFRSGECGRRAGEGRKGGQRRGRGWRRRRKAEGSHGFLPALREGARAAGFVRWPRGSLSPSLRRWGRFGGGRPAGRGGGGEGPGPAWPSGGAGSWGGEKAEPPHPTPAVGRQRGFVWGPATCGRDATLAGRDEALKTGAAGGPARLGSVRPGPAAGGRGCCPEAVSPVTGATLPPSHAGPITGALPGPGGPGVFPQPPPPP